MASGVAISHGINANVIRKWLPLYRDQAPTTLPVFIPLKTEPKRQPETSAIIELPVGQQTLTVEWQPPILMAVPGSSAG